ncbi:protein translocase subunit SecF [Treponema zioleckii]|uniref:protein translocase subunit SecF n=1 Tax=Treponema zioleckii TaxID=331680 RepID=UPI00168B3416|nr:protein translocase subunit SecF [Treponema zioleckii]
MKKIIQFSKFFPVAVVLSIIVIVTGISSIVTSRFSTANSGINFGRDFKAGIDEVVRIAPTVLKVTYTGSADVSLELNDSGLQAVISGIGAENQVVSLPYSENKKISAVAEKLNAIEGVSAVVVDDVELDFGDLFVDSISSSKLSSTPMLVHSAKNAKVHSADEVRAALKAFDDVDVKALGEDKDVTFQIGLGLSAEEKVEKIQADTAAALKEAFGADEVAVISSDSMSAQFSQSLIKNSIILVLATLVLIFIYSTVRFHWDFAFAAVIAIVHDALIMVTFISLSQLKFTTTTIAAILTIIGYSINATVVILDRVRSDLKLVEAKSFTDVLNSALTATLGRSIITTVTTLFAVFALFFFTTGTIHDFAAALIVGLISGCYSSIFISGAFIAAMRKNYKFTVATAGLEPHVAQFKTEE